MIHSTVILLLLVLVSFALGQNAAPASPDIAWPPIMREQKPWTRWWWPGNAVDAKNLSRELEQFHDAGIGGVEITPIYGIQGMDDREIKFISPPWIEMLKHVGAEGNRLGLGVDMATCTGWPFGGPMVTPEDADAVIKLEGDQLVTRPSKMKVKRAAPGGEGWVLNPFSIHAIDTYLKAFEVLPRDVVRGQFHDSFEYAGDWSDEVFDRFKQMHGYDLHERAKELFGTGDPDVVARVKSDYREAIAAAHLAYIGEWVKWCHEHGFVARNQAHGAPGNLLDLYAIADIPETETFGSTPFTIPGFRRDPNDVGPASPSPMVTKFASSAAHVSGKQLTSSETLTWLREHFRVALSMAKPEIDQMFLAGVNHIFFHGSCYSPEDAAWPGWLFYASTEMNPRDTLWHNVGAMNAYIARCQSILQSGKPDNDILVYFPVYDMWDTAKGMEINCKMAASPPWLAGSEFEKTVKELGDGGYSCDFVSDDQLANAAAADGGDLKMPGGKYRALMVPVTHKMPPATLAKIISLAQGGATVIFCGDIPQDAPGMGNLDERRAQLKQTVAGLTFAVSGIGPRVAEVGKGRVIVGNGSLPMILPLVKLRHESFVRDGVDFIRRTHEQGHHYFIAALGTGRLNGWTPLSVACESALIMDPLTGKTGVAAVRKPAQGEGCEIYLKLEPGQSIIVRTFASKKVAGDAWENLEPVGEPVEISGQWRVDFIEGAPELPKPFATDKLASWTKLADDEAKTFAGTGRYKITFDKPDVQANEWMLDLGDVRESARVRLNGQDIGVAWSVPFRVSLGSAPLRDKGNVLEIEVTNLPANRIRDLEQRGVKWRIFKEINYVNIHYKPFDASKWPLTDSGLLGPVKLVPMKRVSG